MVILTELSALFGANVLKVVSRGITGPGRYGRKRGRRKISASSPMGRFYGTGMRLTSDAAAVVAVSGYTKNRQGRVTFPDVPTALVAA